MGVSRTRHQALAQFCAAEGLGMDEDRKWRCRSRNSFPDLPMNWIAGSDAGKLAVAALLFYPERFGGKSVLYQSGSEKFTHAELAEMIGRHIGRRLRHATITAEAWETLLAHRAQCDDRINADLARHISAVGAKMRQPAPLNDLFEAVTFERPMTMSEALAAAICHSPPISPMRRSDHMPDRVPYPKFGLVDREVVFADAGHAFLQKLFDGTHPDVS